MLTEEPHRPAAFTGGVCRHLGRPRANVIKKKRDPVWNGS
jgi:hypothetical protein